MSLFGILWTIIFGLGLSYEGYALWRRAKKDTLTEQVQYLSQFPVVRSLLVGIWAWLGWHFWVDPNQGWPFGWIDDFIIIAIGFVAAKFARDTRHG